MFYKETAFQETPIGSIPRDWNCFEISKIANVKGGKRLPKEDKLVDYKTAHPYIRVTDFKDMTVDPENLKYVSPSVHKKIRRYTISSNDVYISIAGTVGLVGTIPTDLDRANLTENAAKICELENIDNKFLAYALSSNHIQRQIQALTGKGTQPKLALFRICKLRVPLAKLPEQKRITEVLSCVDLAIQKTDEVLAKTERLKKGLMQQLLTKGIGHKDFKNTPIGKVPTVWEIVRLGDVAIELGSGLTPRGGSRTYLERGIPFIRSQNVQMNRLDFADIAYISQETHWAMKRSTVFHGDLLLNITGASIGRVAVVPESITEANVNQHVCRIRFSERMDSTFVSFYLSSHKGQQQILSSQAGATRQGLNYQQAKLIQLPCPSLNEQREIVKILSTIVRKLELVKEDRKKMERIKQGLMDLLLTGKVRIKVD